MEIQCLKSHARQGFQLAAVQVLKIRTIFSQRGEKGTGGEGRDLGGREQHCFPYLARPLSKYLTDPTPLGRNHLLKETR